MWSPSSCYGYLKFCCDDMPKLTQSLSIWQSPRSSVVIRQHQNNFCSNNRNERLLRHCEKRAPIRLVVGRMHVQIFTDFPRLCLINCKQLAESISLRRITLGSSCWLWIMLWVVLLIVDWVVDTEPGAPGELLLNLVDLVISVYRCAVSTTTFYRLGATREGKKLLHQTKCLFNISGTVQERKHFVR